MIRAAWRGARIVWEWSVASVLACLLAFVVATIGYLGYYQHVMGSEEIVEDKITLVAFVDDVAVIHIEGRKKQGLPLVMSEERICPASELMDANGRLVACERGESVTVSVSPRAFGVIADGARRSITIDAAPGSSPASYPAGRFDGGHWIVDLSPRYIGDPPIVAVDIEVTHQRQFGKTTELFDRFHLYGPQT